jgi:hypothetical protein
VYGFSKRLFYARRRDWSTRVPTKQLPLRVSTALSVQKFHEFMTMLLFRNRATAKSAELLIRADFERKLA